MASTGLYAKQVRVSFYVKTDDMFCVDYFSTNRVVDYCSYSASARVVSACGVAL